jgi:hypothetical protein
LQIASFANEHPCAEGTFNVQMTPDSVIALAQVPTCI